MLNQISHQNQTSIDDAILSFVIRTCKNKNITWPSAYKVVFQLYKHYFRTGLWYADTNATLAILSNVSERTVKRVKELLIHHKILKRRKCFTLCTLQRDGTKFFERTSAPQIFFKNFLRALIRYTKKHRDPFNIILSKCALSDPRPSRAPLRASGLGQPLEASSKGEQVRRALFTKILLKLCKKTC